MSNEDTDAWRRFCSTGDVSPENPYIDKVEGEEIAIFQREDGEYSAVRNVCPHQNGPLGEGKVEDGCVYCPWHGWQFDLETGEHVHGKATAEMYEIKTEEEDLFIEVSPS